ncbi:hypothetical protein AB0L59_11755 [Streptomyces sp. NPDC052109]|uniref:hypothetical protein n=1 Tax=Streptomyces sp. NPDC052109 TaxID=3155527 RepID=UPI00343B3C97
MPDRTGGPGPALWLPGQLAATERFLRYRDPVTGTYRSAVPAVTAQLCNIANVSGPGGFGDRGPIAPRVTGTPVIRAARAGRAANPHPRRFLRTTSEDRT